jgi:hypothetical protein
LPITLIDLNNDQEDEVLVGLQHPYYTGTSGNMVILLYKRKNNKLELVNNFGINSIAIEEDGKQTSISVKDILHSWKIILINNESWMWDGSKYKLKS